MDGEEVKTKGKREYGSKDVRRTECIDKKK